MKKYELRRYGKCDAGLEGLSDFARGQAESVLAELTERQVRLASPPVNVCPDCGSTCFCLTHWGGVRCCECWREPETLKPDQFASCEGDLWWFDGIK